MVHRFLAIVGLLATTAATPAAGWAARSDPLVDALGSPMVAPRNAADVDALCERRVRAAAASRSSLEAMPLTASPRALARAYDDTYGIIWSLSAGEPRLLNRSHPDAAIRESAGKCVQRGTQALDALRSSKAVFERLLRAARLKGAEYMVARQLDIFKRNGVGRSPQELARIAEVRAEITRLGLEFERNIEADTRTMTVPARRLTGLPAEWVASHRQPNGSVQISNTAPDVFTVARFSPHPDVRRQAMTMFFNRGEQKNGEILAQLLAKRAELARLLGFPDYASYDLQSRMARTPATATSFLDSIAAPARKRAGGELQRLIAAAGQDASSPGTLSLFDLPYASQRLRASEYRIDSGALRRYFPYSRVRDGIFDLARDLFGVEIRRAMAETWTPQVTAYDVVEDGRVLGRFYLDPHPRTGKPAGNAWTIFFRPGLAGRTSPLGALLLNVPEDYLDHSDVIIFLHEFGHLLHHIFAGQGKWAMGNLLEVEYDALEAPSQMLEEWAWDYETVRRFAVSPDGQPIPEALFKQLQAARYAGIGLRTLDDIGTAAVSLDLHRAPPPAARLEAVFRDSLNRYSLVPDPPELHSFASFSHLSSYGAGYYTYIWSRGLAADWMTAFERKGLRDQATARRYRQTILSRGATRSTNDLTRDFLGRDWSSTAYRALLEATR